MFFFFIQMGELSFFPSKRENKRKGGREGKMMGEEWKASSSNHQNKKENIKKIIVICQNMKNFEI